MSRFFRASDLFYRALAATPLQMLIPTLGGLWVASVRYLR